MNISLVDFENAGLELVQNDEEIEDCVLEDIGNQLLESFSNSGFAFIVNHGIPQSRIDDLNKMGDEFFTRSTEYKMKFWTRSTRICYDPMGQLRFHDKVPDLNEGFRFSCDINENDQWPDIPQLKEKVCEMQSICKVLMLRILKALGLAMKLKDKDLFVRAHSKIGKEGNMTCLKVLRYPAITSPVHENQMRLSEHRDFGSVTLLFQDDVGGLQIQSPGGDFVDVPYKADAVVVNIGDTLQHWTCGRLKSAPHHVIIPTDSDERSRVRRSVAYFASLDDDVSLRTSEFEDSEASDVKDEKVMTVYEFMMELFRKYVY